ncbi:MAG TPA: phosphotransferase [Rhodanobacteraceae bacterium]|nr:phosphotransferase [Rhodanobacteraceae bacterium]
MLPKSNWQDLIPHAGTMCLLDAVVAHDAARVHAISATHSSADNPLRSDGRLHAVALCEYGAQAMAVHGALLARERGGHAQPGYLVSLREVGLHVEYIEDLPGTLDVFAEQLLDAGGSLQYAFRVEHRGKPLATGRAAVLVRRGDEP